MSPALSMCVAVLSGARRHNTVLRSGASWLKKQHQGSVFSERDSQAALLPFIPTNLDQVLEVEAIYAGFGGDCHSSLKAEQAEGTAGAEPTGTFNSQLRLCAFMSGQ